MSRPQPAVPLRTLAVLTLVVLAVHALLLQAAPTSIRFDEPMPMQRFITRSVEIRPPVAAAVAPPTTPRPARPRPAARPAPAVVAAAPVESGTPAASPAPMPAQAPAEPAPPAVPTPMPVSTSEPEPAAPPRPATAYTVPASARLQYTVVGQVGERPMAGVTGEVLWLQDGAQYQAQAALHFLFGTLRSQGSAGRITAEGLAPERYTDRRRAEVAAHFERDKGRVTFSANTPDAPLLAGAQDRLSLLFQLGSLLAGNPPAYPPGSAISIQTVGPRDADTWVLTVGGEEVLQLPAGEMATVKLTRNPRREFDQKLEAWLAPSLGYLPVRLKLTEPNGDWADQRLKAVQRP